MQGLQFKADPNTLQPVRLQHVSPIARLIAAPTVIWQLLRAVMCSVHMIDVICCGFRFSSVASTG
jgi:hypothetical protein